MTSQYKPSSYRLFRPALQHLFAALAATLLSGAATTGAHAATTQIVVFGDSLSAGFGIGVFGFAQCLIGQRPWALWIFGAMLAAGIGLYVIAQFGQKLGALQTFRLHQIYEAAMGRTVEIH